MNALVSRRQAWVLVVLALVTLAAGGPARAVVTAVNAAPPAANVPVGQTGSATVRWQVTSQRTLAGGAVPVVSTQGVFRAGGPQGPILGIKNTMIQGLAQPTPQQVSVAVVPEALLVPARVLLRAQELGVSQIVYQRSFDDGTPTPSVVAGTFTLNLSGGLSSNFAVTRLALRFPDGSREQIVPEDAEAFVLADITHTGSGRLEARWEVAEPSSTRGLPVFRTLALVRRQLIGSGARTTIRSPDLPTRGDGVYLVRLRITDPETGFEDPVIRYLVNPALDPAPAPVAMVARSPAAGADFAPGMRFAWQPLDGAAVYRLEFHEHPLAPADPDPVGDPAAAGAGPADADLRPLEGAVSPPISGIVVSAAVDHSQLSPLVLEHLPRGQTYWWRVVAFDSHGRLIGRSPLRPLSIPAAQ